MSQVDTRLRIYRIVTILVNVVVLIVLSLWAFGGIKPMATEPSWISALRGALGLAGMTGMAMFVGSTFFRTPEAPPIAGFSMRQWLPIWRQRSWFRPPGFLLAIVGYELFTLCGIALAIISLLT
jgi:hypothetical protein